MSQRVTDTRAVRAFRETATRYCAAIDERTQHDAVSFLGRVQPLLPALCAAALELPELVRAGNFEHPSDRLAVWRPLFDSLGQQLEPYRYYWEIYDPYIPSEPINGCLVDDLVGIYLDLVFGLRAWEHADAAVLRDIVWSWRFSFESHWGHHAIDAQRAIHTLFHVHHIDWPDHPWPPAA